MHVYVQREREAQRRLSADVLGFSSEEIFLSSFSLCHSLCLVILPLLMQNAKKEVFQLKDNVARASNSLLSSFFFSLFLFLL